MRHHRSLISAGIASLLTAGILLVTIASSSPQDGRTFAWEQAPPWMWPLNLILPSQQSPSRSLKLSSFALPTATPSPTPVNQPTQAPQATYAPIPPGAVITPAIGGPTPPHGYYCIDDVDPDMCDDTSSYLVPKGTGGAAGTCGTVISNAHSLVDALPQIMKGTRDSLRRTVSTGCAATGPMSGYLSTYFVIDAYNLSGFPELNKSNPNHVSPSGLFTWWQSAPGYTYIPYNPTVIQQFGMGQKDLTGCVMFMALGSGNYHVAIVNEFERYSTSGDGVLSVLQAGTQMYLDRFPVSGWNVANSSTNQTTISNIAGFGCHT